MTHTAKCPKSGGEDDRVILFAALCFLTACSHDLRHEFAHLFGGTFLHLPCDVGVGAECEACVEVAEHAGHRFYVYAVLERQGCECVSQVMKSQVFQSRVFQDFLCGISITEASVKESNEWYSKETSGIRLPNLLMAERFTDKPHTAATPKASEYLSLFSKINRHLFHFKKRWRLIL